MKHIIKFITSIFLIGNLFFISCKKQRSCESCRDGNKPPIAIAGPDQVITLPTDSISLDGSASKDPDGKISEWLWTKISGPASFIFTNSSTAKFVLKKLIAGAYQFELKVTDAGGLFSKDTMQVMVNATSVSNCNISNRPLINAQLIPVSSLSQTSEGMAVASAGNKILFAGGYTGNYISGWQYYSGVDILDFSTNSWTTADLSVARTGMATTVLGNKIFFAGGVTGMGTYTTRVDIYDASSNTWSTTELSTARTEMVGAAAGNKVLFAAGIGQGFFSPHWPDPPLDIYNASTNTWSADILPNRPTGDNIGNAGIATTVIGTKLYFAGNASDWFAWDFGSITSTINIYDASNNTWSISDLSIPRGFMASIAVNNKNYWAGGLYKQPDNPFTNLVEIKDENTGISTFDCLSQPNAFFSAVLKNNKIVFFTSGVNIPGYWTGSPPVMNKFDIYDISTNTWSIGVLPVNIYGSCIISASNSIYVAGGYVNGVLSNQVWKLEF